MWLWEGTGARRLQLKVVEAVGRILLPQVLGGMFQVTLLHKELQFSVTHWGKPLCLGTSSIINPQCSQINTEGGNAMSVTPNLNIKITPL